MTYKKLCIFLISVSLFFPLSALAGNIDPDNDGSQHAWGENVGWINFEPSLGPGVTVTNTGLNGYAWGENIGWINLSPATGGVVNDGNGNLSGYAWGENIGWINFNDAKINPSTGVFSGFAWGENIGWINFVPNGKPVKTSWRGCTPTAEVCDGVDNDCDGSVDENLTRATTCGVGACAGNTGIEICTAGAWGNNTCNPLAGATAEICDNVDNDCDGSVDENLADCGGIQVCSNNVCLELPPGTSPPDLTVTPSSDNPGTEEGGFQVIIGPDGYPMYYDISTNPPYSGSVRVCINYNDTGLSLNQEQNLRIKHWEGSRWNDATCPAPPLNPDTVNNKICACVDHLSWFAVGYEVSSGTANISVSPTNLNFAQVTVRGSSTKTVIISNTGDGNLTIGTIAISGTDASQFSKLNDRCSGQTIAPSWFCTVDVKCSPFSIGLKSATLNIPSNDPDTPITNVPLSGNGAKVVITSPNGGETLNSGDTWNITWQTSAKVGPVAKSYLYYTTGGGIWRLITIRNDNYGSYPWEVPYVSKIKSSCKVKVVLKDASGKTVGKDVSDEVFTILP